MALEMLISPVDPFFYLNIHEGVCECRLKPLFDVMPLFLDLKQRKCEFSEWGLLSVLFHEDLSLAAFKTQVRRKKPIIRIFSNYRIYSCISRLPIFKVKNQIFIISG